MKTSVFSATGRLWLSLSLLFVLGGCPQSTTPTDTTDNTDQTADTQPAPPAATPKAAAWRAAFDASGVGALSGVWGSGPGDVFMVGGKPDQGEVYHWDGSTWRAMEVPNVPLLVWVYGFGPGDVWAVGVGGGVVHYDGAKWTALDAGTTEDLWGIWGRSSTDIWIVGGTAGGDKAVLIHYDGSTFTRMDLPANDRNAKALFKVWGIGSKTFAVGENGLIIELAGTQWVQVPAGPAADEDFVSLWGNREDNIVAVGGRSSGRIAVYNGTSWRTIKPSGVPGLNAVFMTDTGECVVGGVNGYVGQFDPLSDALTGEDSGSLMTVHALWGDNAGRVYGAGGQFSTPFTGLALLRSTEAQTGAAQPPVPLASPPPPPPDDTPPAPITDCNGNGIEDATDLTSGTSTDCDGNGVPDECDADADGDGVPDACDVCPDGDDHADADMDGVPDFCDICQGSDDTLDSDGDGVPNGCDDCSGDNAVDSDGDGVPDACDICDRGDDHADADGDGVPDACDPCRTDANDDSDGDGVCDSADLCPGSDDSIDRDGDGIPDGCDCFESQCPLGENCGPSGCEPTSDPDVRIGVGDPADPNAPFALLNDFADFDVTCGIQGSGLYNAVISVQVSGFAQGAVVDITLDVAASGGPVTLPVALRWNASGGYNQFLNLHFEPGLFGPLEDIDNVLTTMTVTVTDRSDPSVTASSTVWVTLHATGPFCN